MSRQARRAERMCAEWLAACLRLGWRKTDLDRLETLWWKYHDLETGDVKAGDGGPTR